MDDTDRRVKRTRQRMLEALVALTLEKGYETVTIRDITERADVAYITFYRHFESKDELLLSALDGVIGEIESASAQHFGSPFEEQAGVLWFQHIQENETFLLALFQAYPFREAWKRRFAEAALHSLQTIQQAEPEGLLPIEIAANHIAASFLDLMEWWLTNHKPYPVDTMARIYHQMVILPTVSQVTRPSH